METVLKTEELSKNYGKNIVLDKVSISVPKGSIYGLVGRNGAGKTTLIRVLTGLQKPTSGIYNLFGVNSFKRDISRIQRRIGAVVETPALYLHMSARENLEEQYRILGLPSFEGIDEILTLVGLGDTGKKKVRDFSLGMKQRLGIAIALAGSPDLLILDEPINGLDPQGIIEVRELILKLNREKQITILLSSHILDELSKLATHYGFLDKGRIVKEISSEELEERFQKATRIEVSDINALIQVLDNWKFNYKILSKNSADIFSKFNITQLALELDKIGCQILSLREHNESLESYFINLTGGSRNE